MKKLTAEEVRSQLAAVDYELERLEARRTALITALDTYRPDWKPIRPPEKRPASTMAMVRDVLAKMQREASTAELRAALVDEFEVIPASSLAVMLFRQGSERRSGIYRSVGADGVGRYGLIAWGDPPTGRSNGHTQHRPKKGR